VSTYPIYCLLSIQTNSSKTADHIETLYELDNEIIHETGEPGIKRAESLNGDPMFIQALADLAKEHLESGKATSQQLLLRCPMCTNLKCVEQKVCFSLLVSIQVALLTYSL